MTELTTHLQSGVPSGLRDYVADPARRRLILVALSAVGYGIGLAAMLLLPSSTWCHYLAIVLPPAAFAWSRADGPSRLLLFAWVTWPRASVNLAPATA